MIQLSFGQRAGARFLLLRKVSYRGVRRRWLGSAAIIGIRYTRLHAEPVIRHPMLKISPKVFFCRY
jgi:hypothetical protein